MSTRCNVIIDNGRAGFAHHEIILYHHHDGYPEGVGSSLASFLKANGFKKGERWYGERIATGLVKMQNDEYECSMGLHGDIEYLYILDCFAGKLKCYDIDWNIVGLNLPMNRGLICQDKYLLPIPGWDGEKEAEDGR